MSHTTSRMSCVLLLCRGLRPVSSHRPLSGPGSQHPMRVLWVRLTVVYIPLPSIPAGAKAGGVRAWGEAGSGASQNTVMGPALARSVTPALITRFYSPPLVCCSHVHTTSMVRWSDPDRSMSDPLDVRPVERGDSPGNLPRSLVVLIPSLSSRREPR